MLACTSPETMIGPVALQTDRIRVGSGGVMLPHYSPVKVAESFSILSALAPDRIDLGIGRAPGTDQITALALQRDRRQAAPDDFPQQLVELLALLEDKMPADHPFARLASILPGQPERPEVWLLGSSPQSGIWAAELGLPYSFADFINPEGAAIAADYRSRFSESGRAAEPTVSVGVVAVCAETDEDAERLAASHRMAFSLLRQGRLIKVPPVDQALRFLASEGEQLIGGSRRITAGTPDQVRAGIETIAQQYGADEVIVVTITHEHAARRRSYELLADAFGLQDQLPRAA
jgi:luciferase family oxidoreductase group 1